jgi:hypothetical protein
MTTRRPNALTPGNPTMRVQRRWVCGAGQPQTPACVAEERRPRLLRGGPRTSSWGQRDVPCYQGCALPLAVVVSGRHVGMAQERKIRAAEEKQRKASRQTAAYSDRIPDKVMHAALQLWEGSRRAATGLTAVSGGGIPLVNLQPLHESCRRVRSLIAPGDVYQSIPFPDWKISRTSTMAP